MSDVDLLQKVEDEVKRRKEDYAERIKEMEQHPRCAILPSPEKLYTSSDSPGSDETSTLTDFDLIKDWVTEDVTESKLASFYDWSGASRAEGGNLDDGCYYGFISLAFSTAFAAMRNTASPHLAELVFWYYAGHGLSKEGARDLRYSSTPRLTGPKSCLNLISEYHAAANEFVTEGRKVKGGELCLHKVGFCDLYGLLKPWIAAVKEKSINAEGCSKKNKHLAIILDSCYSGIIAEELTDFKTKMNDKDLTFLGENSVTIQAACGSDEGTFGGYFTPCFVYLNDPRNAELLDKLKAEWMGMTDEVRNEYKALKLPSPMVVTTRPQSQDSQDVTMEVTVQNFKLTLFKEPGFFKFCSIKVYQHTGNSNCWFNGQERVLNLTSVNDFLSSRPFTVLDYKLKKLVNGPYAGSPMGLFLLEDPQNPDYAVCAHIHFQIGNTNSPQRINLVHHKKPPMGSVLYLEDHDGLSHHQITKKMHKVPIQLDGNAQDLVQACHTYVESKEQGRWTDVSRWNMKGVDLGVNGLFRVQEQRCAWEGSYLKHIKEFHLPEVADN